MFNTSSNLELKQKNFKKNEFESISINFQFKIANGLHLGDFFKLVFFNLIIQILKLFMKNRSILGTGLNILL